MKRTNIFLFFVFLFTTSALFAQFRGGGAHAGGSGGGYGGGSGWSSGSNRGDGEAGGGHENYGNASNSINRGVSGGYSNQSNGRLGGVYHPGTSQSFSRNRTRFYQSNHRDSWSYSRAYSGSNFNGTHQYQAARNYPPAYSYTNRNGIGFQNSRNIGATKLGRSTANGNQLLSAGNLRHTSVLLPTRGFGGGVLSASVIPSRNMSGKAVRNQMSAIAHNSNFSRNINAHNGSENRSGHYYWHNWNGGQYCHYRDQWGCNWYGWYAGNDCFWTQYYLDNWWWYDPSYSRWCYWDDGWCWQDPASNVYVYNDGSYLPTETSVNDGSDSDGGPSETTSGGDATPTSFQSLDNSRTINLEGPDNDAILYKSDENDSSSRPIFLASHVTEAKFSNPDQGPLRILLFMDDGNFELFNADGARLDRD